MKYKFICPIFDCDVHLIIGDKSEALKFCDLELTNNHVGKCIEIYDKKTKKSLGYLVWVKDKKNFYIMVHETVHLTKQIFETHNIPFTPENDELIAYYQNYWIRRFWKVMSKTKGKKGNKK